MAAAFLSQRATQAAAASNPGKVSWSIRRCACGETTAVMPVPMRALRVLAKDLEKSVQKVGPGKPARPLKVVPACPGRRLTAVRVGSHPGRPRGDPPRPAGPPNGRSVGLGPMCLTAGPTNHRRVVLDQRPAGCGLLFR